MTATTKKSTNKLKLGLVSSLFALPLMLGMQACTEEEVGVAVGAAAIGAGAIIIADSVNDGRPARGRYECQGGYRTACESYYDYYGYLRQDCHRVYDRCAYREYRRSYSAFKSDDKALTLANLPSDVSSVEWSQTFYMSHSSAQKLVDALKDARSGNSQKLLAMGLEPKDIARMANLRSPSREGMEALARNLDQQTVYTKQMVKKLLSEAKKNRASF